MEDTFYAKLNSWRTKHFSLRRFIYFLSILTGILSGFAAILLKNTVYYTHHFLTSSFDIHQVNFLYLLYPLFGIGFTVLFIRLFIKENITHGISRVLHAISQKNSRLERHDMYSSLAASTITVGFGGSVGLEAPIVLTGSAIASNLGRFFRLDHKVLTLLIGCGSAGAVSGIFNAPIAGVVFALEVMMLDLSLTSVIPLLLSSIAASTVAALLMGKMVLFSFTPVHPFDLANIPFYILLGAVSGMVALYFTRMNYFVEDLFDKVNKLWVRLIGGGLILSLLIFLFPPLYGEGYASLKDLLNGMGSHMADSSFFYGIQSSEGLFLIFIFAVLVLKVVSMSVTTGAGGVGGVFAPSLYVGGLTGFFLAKLINFTGYVKLPETNFVLAGMAGVMAGVMHAPLTAIFLIAELTGGYGFFIPLMITATLAYIVNAYFEPHSVYTKRLASLGQLTSRNKDKAILSKMKIDDLIETNFNTVPPRGYLGDLVREVARSERNVFPVVDRDNVFYGVVFINDVRDILFKPELYGKVLISEIMYMPDPLIEIGETVESVAQKFHDTSHYNLPVIDHGKYVGFISRAKLFFVYREMLKETQEDM